MTSRPPGLGIPPARLRARPYLHVEAGTWPQLRRQLASGPSYLLQLCRHDCRPGPTRPPRFNTAVLEAAAFVAAVTDQQSDLDFLRSHIDLVLAPRGMDMIGVLRGHFLAALAFSYDLLADVLSEPERAALGRTLVDHAGRAAEAVELGMVDDWPRESPKAVCTLAGLNLAGLALLGEDPLAAEWVALSDARLDQVLQSVATDGWWPTGFEDWNLLLPLLVRVADAWEHLALRDRFDCGLFREAWAVALHAVAPSERDVIDVDLVGHREVTRRAAEASGRPGARYRWRHEPCTPALDRLGRRFQHPGFRLAAERWRARRWGRGSPWAVLWDPGRLPLGAAQPDRPYHVFESHGLAVWRAGWQPEATALAFTTGPAYGSPTRPWHPVTELDGDANQLLLWSAGQALISDHGRPIGPATHGHSTVLVDGEGQLTTLAQRPAAASLAATWLTALGGALVGRAGGAYPPATGLTTFDRHLAFTPEYVVVWDVLGSERPVRYEWLLQTHGTITTAGADRARLSVGEAGLEIVALRPHLLQLVVRPVPDHGPPFGEALAVTGAEPVQRTQFLVVLAAAPGQGPAPVTAELLTGESAVGARLSWRDGDLEEVLFPTRGRGIVFDHLISDAASLALRRQAAGDWSRLIARRVGQVLVPGGEIVSASQPVDLAFAWQGGLLVGEVDSTTGATLTVRCPFVPRGVLVDGASGRARMERGEQLVSVRLTAGRHDLRISGR